MKNLKAILWALFAVFALSFAGCQSGNQEGDENESEYAEHDEESESAETEEQIGEEGEEGEEGPGEESGESLPSPRQQASGEISGVSITVDYGSPAVKGRTVWGGLEAYGKVWRAGANETTSVELSGDVTVNGNDLAAGKYAIFMIPNENADWIVIFNNGWDAWGAFSYSEDQDVLRFSVTPEWSEDVVERLTYNIDDGLKFAWEKARINMEVKAKQ